MKNNIQIYHSFPTEEWSGGTTTELFIYPPQSSYKERNFLFRVSSATITDAESTFTRLPGVERILLLLEGELELSHSGIKEALLLPDMQHTFLGDWDITSSGIGTDINLMLREDMEGSLKVCYLLEGEKENLTIYQGDEEHMFMLLYVCEGTMYLQSGTKNIIGKRGDLIVMQRMKDSIADGYIMENRKSEKLRVIKTVVKRRKQI